MVISKLQHGPCKEAPVLFISYPKYYATKML